MLSHGLFNARKFHLKINHISVEKIFDGNIQFFNGLLEGVLN